MTVARGTCRVRGVAKSVHGITRERLDRSCLTFAPAGMEVPSVYVCNLCRPEISPFGVINVHVFENIGPFGGCTGVCLFELGLFYAEISFVGDREPCQNVQCRHLSVCIGPLSNWRAVCQQKRFICWIRGPLQKLHPLSASEDTAPSW